MTRKGRLEEIFSRALYADDPFLYFVSYRDFDSIVEVPLQEFVLLSENFSVIPASRIAKVRRGNETLYKKSGL
ncbi:hypothetical protein NTE_01253 [Candidatus Nitrososphaera evergladensis SR1]|uniref:DUF504 domain-containing protein n=1 Tax=Candidatus Nitrososphaera evergladensis SR1 TaxID=1459636 RepID=A0A075MQ65_9ARCH|nr:DUF504 domain-containing protein [Candidatus Nitrososphaera evergladensis]AIF83323.1 hypothetical protein NTE_01253 [Candidatus Nitrososphaera evergladensis SR1]